MPITDEENEKAESAAIADRIRDLLDQRGIGRRQQASEIQRILGLSYSQAHRKMRGENPWTIVQLKLVAEEFGESPSVFVESVGDDSGDEERVREREAFILIGSKSYSCFAAIGSELRPGPLPEFVAMLANNQWLIYVGADVPAGRHFSVGSIEINPQQAHAKKHTIAVLDDERSITDNVCEFLNGKGFIARPYNSGSALQKALRTVVFDAFIIDWLVGEETAEESIRQIRASDNSRRPIFLLTGKLESGEADQDDVARVIRTFDVNSFEKPARLPLLSAELQRSLAYA